MEACDHDSSQCSKCIPTTTADDIHSTPQDCWDIDGTLYTGYRKTPQIDVTIQTLLAEPEPSADKLGRLVCELDRLYLNRFVGRGNPYVRDTPGNYYTLDEWNARQVKIDAVFKPCDTMPAWKRVPHGLRHNRDNERADLARGC